MKKILTLMGTITFDSVIVAPVLACSDQQQDSILKAITNGNGNYNGWESALSEVGIKKPAVFLLMVKKLKKSRLLKKKL